MPEMDRGIAYSVVESQGKQALCGFFLLTANEGWKQACKQVGIVAAVACFGSQYARWAL